MHHFRTFCKSVEKTIVNQGPLINCEKTRTLKKGCPPFYSYPKCAPINVELAVFFGVHYRHVSATEGHLDMVKFLVLQPGIDINAEDKTHLTPLLGKTKRLVYLIVINIINITVQLQHHQGVYSRLITMVITVLTESSLIIIVL